MHNKRNSSHSNEKFFLWFFTKLIFSNSWWRSGFFTAPPGQEHSERYCDPIRFYAWGYPVCCFTVQHSQMQNDDLTQLIRFLFGSWRRRMQNGKFSLTCKPSARSPMFFQVSLFNFQRTTRVRKISPLIHVTEWEGYLLQGKSKIFLNLIKFR